MKAKRLVMPITGMGVRSMLASNIMTRTNMMKKSIMTRTNMMKKSIMTRSMGKRKLIQLIKMTSFLRTTQYSSQH